MGLEQVLIRYSFFENRNIVHLVQTREKEQNKKKKKKKKKTITINITIILNSCVKTPIQTLNYNSDYSVERTEVSGGANHSKFAISSKQCPGVCHVFCYNSET